MKTMQCDIVVIGGGGSGLVAAAGLPRLAERLLYWRRIKCWAVA